MKFTQTASAALIVLGGLVLAETQTKTQDSKQKSAQELPYFKLSWTPKNYDPWKSTGLEKKVLTKEQIKALPSRVDNSKHSAWSGIGNQGQNNCCAQEGTVAGMLSYEMNIFKKRKADKAEHRLPAHFSWNMFNFAKNSGTEMIHGLETAKEIGIPSQASYGGRYGKNISVQRSSVKGHPEPGKLQERITAAARAGASDCDQFQIMEVTPPATKRPRASSYVASPQPDRKHESPGMSTEAKLRVATERAYAAGASHAANVITYANSTTSQQPLFQQPRLAPWSPPCNTFFGSPQLAPPGGLGSIYLQQLLQQRPDARAWYGDLL